MVSRGFREGGGLKRKEKKIEKREIVKLIFFTKEGELKSIFLHVYGKCFSSVKIVGKILLE